MKACVVSSKENALPVICLFVYCLSSNDQQMATSSVRTAWEQEWASVWSEELSHFIQSCTTLVKYANVETLLQKTILLSSGRQTLFWRYKSCYHLNINCVDGKPTVKRPILLQNEFSWKKLRCAFFHPRSNVSILQQIRLLKVLWILYFWLDKFRGSDAIHRSYVTCCKTSLPWVGKRATCTDFVAKVELLSVFWDNFSQLATTWFVASQVWTWVVKRAESLFNSFCINVANKLHIFLPILPYLNSQVNTQTTTVKNNKAQGC